MSDNPSVHRAAAEGFASGAETYARGRPDYPPQALEWLRDTLGLQPGRTVVDLGAGTGKFTKVLLRTGARVIAVDPVLPMLDRLRRDVPGVDALAGDAEHLPLADGSVDAVVCAQSFHWFASYAALEEIRRVLNPLGVLGLIWNQRDLSTPWLAEMGKILDRHAGDAPRMASGQWRKLFPAPGFRPLHEIHFPHAHVGPPERVIVDRFMSVSFMAALPAAERERVVAEVRRLIDATPALAGRTEVSVPYVTMAFHCFAGNIA